MAGTQEPDIMYTKQLRIASLAGRFPQRAFTSLAHHLDAQWLKAAYLMTCRDSAVEVDGQMTGNFEADIQHLLEEAKNGRYQAPPMKRVHIPKENRRTTRSVDIHTFEDKILQRAVVALLEPLYRHDFLECSYGFRSGGSAHQAVKTVWDGLTSMGGGWIIDLDIRPSLDTIVHQHLREFLQQRVKDGIILDLIDKWLKAGVLEAGQRQEGGIDIPQEGGISPLLTNIYLHYVLDEWFEYDVKPRLRGRALEVRVSDEAILAFSNKADAHRVMEVLPKRFARFGLALPPNKTVLRRFMWIWPDRTGGPPGCQSGRSWR